MDKNNQRAAHPDGPKPLYGMSIEGVHQLFISLE